MVTSLVWGLTSVSTASLPTKEVASHRATARPKLAPAWRLRFPRAIRGGGPFECRRGSFDERADRVDGRGVFRMWDTLTCLDCDAELPPDATIWICARCQSRSDLSATEPGDPAEPAISPT